MKNGLDIILYSLLFSLIGLGVILMQFSPNDSGTLIKILFFVFVSISVISLFTLLILFIKNRINKGSENILRSFYISFYIFLIFGSIIIARHQEISIINLTGPILFIILVIEILLRRMKKKKEIINDFS